MRGAFKHSKRHGLKNVSNTWMKVESNETNWCWKFGNERKSEEGNKTFEQNNKWESQMPYAHPPT